MWTLLALASGFNTPLQRPAAPFFAPAAPVGAAYAALPAGLPPQVFVEPDPRLVAASRGRGRVVATARNERTSFSSTVSCLLLAASGGYALGAAAKPRARAARMQNRDEQELSPEARDIARKLRGNSADGRDIAPWMNLDPEAIAEQKRKREEYRAKQSESSRVDSMNIDPQASELSGTGGLKSKVLGEEEVELRWSTQGEEGNAGFIVQRRPGGTGTFSNIATFENFAPLRTKGPQGGDYVYLDDTAAPGTWVYRIVDCDTEGVKVAISQKLVEIESQSEATQQFIVGVVIFGIAIACVVFGLFYDPIQTTDKGAAFF